jgi:hypothetical protein
VHNEHLKGLLGQQLQTIEWQLKRSLNHAIEEDPLVPFAMFTSMPMFSLDICAWQLGITTQCNTVQSAVDMQHASHN